MVGQNQAGHRCLSSTLGRCRACCVPFLIDIMSQHVSLTGKCLYLLLKNIFRFFLITLHPVLSPPLIFHPAPSFPRSPSNFHGFVFALWPTDSNKGHM